MNLLSASVLECEKQFEHIVKNQCRDKAKLQYGGYYNKDFGLVSTQCGIEAYIPIVVYYCPQSRYYRDPKALECADLMLEHLLTNQHEDGTLDYFACNYHSAPDSAFITLNLARAAKLVTAGNDAEAAFQKKLLLAIERLGKGILFGGFHTPNHRWVMSAALALVNTLMPDPRYLERIEQFLSEGIDCNEDGEYTERSAGGYNEINNRAMIILCQELGKTELLAHVRRNLLLMLAFFHDDFSIFTENSTRQDKGNIVYGEKYLYQYIICGHMLQDDSLKSIGVRILNDWAVSGRPFPFTPDFLMLFGDAFEHLPEPACDDIFAVNRLLKQSGVLRVSKDKLHVWAVERQPSFLFVKCGAMDFYIKGGINFFNCRHLTVEHITESATGYEMTYKGAGRYYLPFENYSGQPLWGDMRNGDRDKTPELEIEVKIRLTPCENGFDLAVSTQGCPGSTIRFEIGMLPNVLVSGDGYKVPAAPGGTLIASKGFVSLYDGDNTLEIGPAFAANEITKGLFGSVPPSADRFNLFFNDETNFDRVITIRTK